LLQGNSTSLVEARNSRLHICNALLQLPQLGQRPAVEKTSHFGPICKSIFLGQRHGFFGAGADRLRLAPIMMKASRDYQRQTQFKRELGCARMSEPLFGPFGGLADTAEMLEGEGQMAWERGLVRGIPARNTAARSLHQTHAVL